MGTLACLVSGIALSGTLMMAHVHHSKRGQLSRRAFEVFRQHRQYAVCLSRRWAMVQGRSVTYLYRYLRLFIIIYGGIEAL